MPQSNYVEIQAEGLCHWTPRFDQSVTQCPVDVTWFPNDEQSCDLVFQSWQMKENTLKIVTTNDSVDLQLFLEPNDWKLTGACR